MEDDTIGLYFYNSRYYDPRIGRFIQADTIVPELGDPQAFNRYSYVHNNPLKYTDPSGNDPIDEAWEKEFYDAHGDWPTDQDRRDRFFSLLFPGSGPNGAWTDSDWTYYHSRREALWKGRGELWSGAMDPGLDRFIIHLKRLASYYKPGEEIFYVKAIGLIWGGVPLDTPARAMAQMATNPGAAWAENTPLFEGTENWKPRLVDDRNPSHHYAGLLYVGFFSGAPLGHTINWLRDGPLSDPSQPDIELGRVAVDHGAMLYDYIINLEELGSAVRYALDVRPAIWPKNTPGARVPWYYYFPPHPH